VATMKDKKPKIVFHANVLIIQPIIDLYNTLGADASRGSTNNKEDIISPGAAHLVWGMIFNKTTYRYFRKLSNVFLIENGWFKPGNGCWIDSKGPGPLSSLVGAALDRKADAVAKEKVNSMITWLRERRAVPEPIEEEEGYIFVPLQIESDCQIKYWSNCDAPVGDRQKWFVKQVLSEFPTHRVVIRPHPRHPELGEEIEQMEEFKDHGQAKVTLEGKSYDYFSKARAVVGVNSTTLLEALTFYKPVCAMGDGIFTNNEVMLEAKGDGKCLKNVLDFQPDPDRITAFLDLLIERQVTYKNRPRFVHKFPVFLEVLEEAKRQVANQ